MEISSLDQLYQDTYDQIQAKIEADFKAFKDEKPNWKEIAIIEAFVKELNRIAKNIIDSNESIEINKTDYNAKGYNPLRQILIPRFRSEREKKYKFNPVQNFFLEHRESVHQESITRFWNAFLNKKPSVEADINSLPSNEELAKILAAVDAYDDYARKLSQSLSPKLSKTPTPMSVQATLRKWLAAGEIERTVDALQSIAENFGDQYFQRDVTHQAGRFNGLKRERQLGTMSDEFYNLQLNNIRQALQDLIDKIPANATLEGQSDQPEPPAPTPEQPTSDQPKPPTHSDVIKPTTSPHIPWIVGLVLLIGATGLAVVVPCPSESLTISSRILLALGAAGIATVLPGLFNINLQGIKAGSAVGVFALVYLVNPASAMTNNDGCNEPFEFTINLQRDRNLNLSPQYPKLENVALQLWLDNKWEEVMVSDDNLADFKSIPGKLRNQTVPVRFQTQKYWKLTQYSVTLSGKSQTLTIAPDGLLGTVSGKVRSEQDATFLSGVEVEIEGVLDTTDARGNFNVAIPPDKQKSRYIYIAQKKDYETKTEPFEFDGEPIEIRLKKQ